MQFSWNGQLCCRKRVLCNLSCHLLSPPISPPIHSIVNSYLYLRNVLLLLSFKSIIFTFTFLQTKTSSSILSSSVTTHQPTHPLHSKQLALSRKCFTFTFFQKSNIHFHFPANQKSNSILSSSVTTHQPTHLLHSKQLAPS